MTIEFRMSDKRKVPPVVWTILCVLLLAAGATPYGKTADVVLITIRLLSLIVISALVVREWWRYHHRDGWTNTREDAGQSFLLKLRRWSLGEPPAPKRRK